MNTESIDCRRVEMGAILKPGDFCYDDDRRHIFLWLPGTGGPDAISISRQPAAGVRIWTWDGNEDKPTLTPSILAPGQWHGWLRGGRLVSC